MQLLLLVQKVVLGNSATATTASKCTGNSATATKLAATRNIKLQGAVSGNAEFDGSKDITIITTQTNIAVLTGTIKTKAAGGTDNTAFNTLKIDFPTSFNSENCVVLSLAMYHGTNNKYAFGCTNSSDPRTWLVDGVGAMITFDYKGDGKITLTVETPFTQEYTYKYKIVLMKIT